MPDLADELLDSRARLLELVLDLDDVQWMGPKLPIVNPIRWELGHVAWFQERWVLRHARGLAPIRRDGDALFDSSAVPHDARWDLPLPSRDETLSYLTEVLDRALEGGVDPYFHRLVLFHEDMHCEALTYTRQTHAYGMPRLSMMTPETDAREIGGGPLPGDVEVPGGRFFLGAQLDAPFVFDNEKWAHPIDVQTFRIARACVTNAEYADFVDAGGYRKRELWSDEGWAWRAETNAEHPCYWEKSKAAPKASAFGPRDGWLRRGFDAWGPLPPHRPVVHVCYYEAEAYCRFAKRRLPSEVEWELAASTLDKRQFPWGNTPPTPRLCNLDGRSLGVVDVGAHAEGESAYGCRQMLGNVWEWTASDFKPYPGFVIDPYKEYSEPWFHAPHKVLRGGCWATRSRLLRNTYRNFFSPHRRDVIAGFRTCAL